MSGKGKPGYCKICDHPAASFINGRREREGEAFNAKLASEFAQTLDPDFKFTRQTWYAHLEHITHPLVTAHKRALANPTIVPKTTIGGLELIRDLGLQRAAEHPEEVTIDHGLKALTELNRKQATTDEVLVVIAKVLSGQESAEVIVGEWRELPPAQEDKQLGTQERTDL